MKRNFFQEKLNLDVLCLFRNVPIHHTSMVKDLLHNYNLFEIKDILYNEI